MEIVDLKLTVDEVNVILRVLGDLPTHMGSYPLMMKVKAQADKSLDDKKKSEGLKDPSKELPEN